MWKIDYEDDGGDNDGYLCDVCHVAVLHHVVSDGSPANVYDQLHKQEVPVQLLEEDVVEAVWEAAKELTEHREQEQTLPSVMVRPGTGQKGKENPEMQTYN